MSSVTCKFACSVPEDCDGSCGQTWRAATPAPRVRPLLQGKRMPPSMAGCPPSLAPLEDTKDSNPKDRIGAMKLPLHLVPGTMQVYAALAFAEGQAKYGAYNWRVAGVRASVYFSALQRHLTKYWNGEDLDPKTLVPHLASALACIAVLVDASVADKLTDDRPPALSGVPDLIDHDAYAVVQNVRELFAGSGAPDYTIEHTV